jgi:uncharacterized damage-inducible protein DinB
MNSTSAELAAQLDTSYRDLCQTLSLLDADELEQARLDDGWTPKALLAHIAFWDDYQLRRLQAAASGASGGHRPAPPAVDNDQRAAADARRAWGSVEAEADAARRRLADYAAQLSPDGLAQTYPEDDRMLSTRGLLEHMVRHTREHGQALHRYCGSMRRWSRAGLRRFFDRQYCELLDSVAGLTEADLLRSTPADPWSLRDLLAHVLGWNEFCYLLLDQWPAPKPDSIQAWAWQPGETEDAYNARLLARQQHLDPIAIADGLVTYHRRMLRLFDAFTDDQLASTGQTWGGAGELSGFYFEIALHEVEHAAEIWRRRME